MATKKQSVSFLNARPDRLAICKKLESLLGATFTTNENTPESEFFTWYERGDESREWTCLLGFHMDATIDIAVNIQEMPHLAMTDVPAFELEQRISAWCIGEQSRLDEQKITVSKFKKLFKDE